MCLIVALGPLEKSAGGMAFFDFIVAATPMAGANGKAKPRIRHHCRKQEAGRKAHPARAFSG
jgi:hypothetical protein